jgi:lysophospholipase L1-like esterase
MKAVGQVLGFLVGGLGMLLIVWPVRLRRRIAGPHGRGRAFGRSLLGLGLICLYYVAIIEVSVRVLRLFQGEPTAPSWHRVDDSYLFAFHPFRAMELRPGAVVEHGTAGHKSRAGESYVINAYGCRGPELADKASGRKRVICAGGSSTFGVGLEEEDAWPARLAAQNPDWSVLNAGVLGYTSPQVLAFAQGMLFDLEPDLLIVYVGRNDMHVNESLHPESFRSDYAHTHGMRQPYTGLSGWLVRHSWICLTLARWQQDVSSAMGKVMRGQGPPVTKMGPRGLAAFRRNIADLVALAARRGVKVLLVSEAPGYLPLEMPDGSENPHLFRLRAVAPNIPPEAYTRGLEAYADELARVGAPFLDLTRGFPRDPELFVDEIHLSGKGGAELARRVSPLARDLLAAD